MKNIIFVTATRADYGKLKSIILSIQKLKKFNVHVFVTGMHNLSAYGSTFYEIKHDKVQNIKKFHNQILGENSSKIFSKTVLGFSEYVNKTNPDLVIIHGDRIEPLACAVVCCLNNIKLAHFEGGELSGTIDEILRHSISKLSNIHFVTNSIAKKRLIQMGELSNSIFITGSPDVDLILSNNLPSLYDVKKKYDIAFKSYAIALFHPVTTDIKNLKKNITNFIRSLKLSKENIVLIFPNNDLGSEVIIKEYKKIRNNNIKVFPSLRFEYYLTLLKNCKFIIGNSSSGIMEAPYYGVATINIGDRQNNRANLESITNCSYESSKILRAIKKFSVTKKFTTSSLFGDGRSAAKLLKILKSKKIWKINNQKQFRDITSF
ncbi:WecB UDP-N-acetylglucosamine 2-epimerase [Candidatus Pelagibacterales bacterium]|jgi:UDP-N-acetylglucosamine 2-epimerase (hydrolysing)